MRELPDRPDMDHFRHQARALQRGALAGDTDALRRLRAVSHRMTLAAAQLAIAREYGFASWVRLQAGVKQRRLELPSAPAEFVIRPVASIDELAVVFDFVFAQMSGGITHEDRRYHDLVRRFESDRSLMLVVENRGRIVAGALMFNTTLRAIALQPAARGKGLGRRLLETIEQEAARLGRGGMSLGVGRGPSAARDFFTHLGYTGRSRMGKQLPPSLHIRYAHADEWRRRLEELRVRRARRIAPNRWASE